MNTLQARIDEYIAKYDSGIKQHTLEWYTARKRTIGGSEISIVQGTNHYSDVNKLIAQKIELIEFEENITMHWGTLFESVLRDYVSIDRKTSISGHDIFIADKYANQSYSPDGIGILDYMGKPTIALFEFKCPMTRNITAKIPNYYLPQIKTGLDTIPIVDVGLYAEAVFRRCQWNTLEPDNMDYDTMLLNKSTKLIKNIPLAYGCIVFIMRNKARPYELYIFNKLRALNEYYYTNNMCLSYGNKMNPCDLIHLSKQAMEILLSLYSIGVLEAHSLTADTSNLASLKPKLLEICNTVIDTEINYGVLCWKLIQVNYHFVEKEPGYLEEWMPIINEITGVISRCIDTPEQKYKIYNEYCNQIVMEGGFEE